MYDKIISLIQQQGPSLPVEVSGKLNLNSFLAKAYLEELVQQGRLIRGDKVGSTHVFFLSGQEDEAKKRAEEYNNTTRTVAAHIGKELDMSPEAVKKREQFKQHFQKAISEPAAQKKAVEEKREEFKPLAEIEKNFGRENIAERINKVFRKEETVSPPSRMSAPPPKNETHKSAYVEQVLKLFNTDKARIVEELDVKKKTAELIIDFPSSIGAIRYYVEIKDKKTISKADVSIAYTEGLARKLPSMIITRGKLAHTAEDYAESLGSLFKLKVIK